MTFNDSMNIVVAMLESLAHMALVTIAYGIIQRASGPRPLRSLLHALAFSVGAVSAMLSPAILAPGILIDGRATVVGLAAAFAGPLAAIITASTAISYRVSVGGSGTAIGCATILTAAAVGLIWAHWQSRKDRTTLRALVVLGLGLSSHAVIVLFVPMDGRIAVLAIAASTLALVSFLATVVFGQLMHRENQLIERERMLRTYAFADPLTGLPNRREFETRIGQCVETAKERGAGCLLLMDFDHFKLVNDRFGHAAGDEALKQLAVLLKSSLREDDFVARHGGEEFVAYLPGTAGPEALRIAERVRQRIARRTMSVCGHTITVTVSIGVAVADAGLTLNDLFISADRALYRAKTGGRDRVELAANREREIDATIPTDALLALQPAE
ncbi:GGDEF domain-containing protein [Consotaella aegiceratis]|uniref:GGDEF domain-containing protein n=1 Tax=Consotaella aegiceratis TaxID=3097961 RepID=UPI002F3F1BF1